jgi:diketogulonate reductase-like aldo/keto reductase
VSDGRADTSVGKHNKLLSIDTDVSAAFRFALEVGMMPLRGTTDADHMRADLDVFNFRLEPPEVERIEGLVTR